ncbi:hypothetical protein FCIRC_8598 [Fusarium circinatum]|uniref:Uncharacterized protein n=1 Tax=Fusarium circinatum TaxID=48490 RepID=A0A8H5WVJ3_FUSCI|nr:hypothetical protein FCIRC_8598 [Fusarium circinatum]
MASNSDNPSLRSLPPLWMAGSHDRTSRLRLQRPQQGQRHIAISEQPTGETATQDDLDQCAGSNGSDGDDHGDMSGIDMSGLVPQYGSPDDGGDRDDATDGLVEIMDQLDIDAVDQDVPNIDRILFSPGFDELEFRAAADYNDAESVNIDLGLPGIDLGEFDMDFKSEDGEFELHEDQQSTAQALGGMLAPDIPGSRRASAPANEDQSVLVHHTPKSAPELSDFELALGLMAHITGTNNRDWSIFREVLQIPLKPGETRPDVTMAELPRALTTLKCHVID